MLAALTEIERDGGDGMLALPDGKSLHVTSLDKVYFPKTGATKGALMRFYTQLATGLLPAIADRPLVLRRYPEGIGGSSFHQHDPGARTPTGVRVETVMGERRLVGGDLATLLYTVQLGTIPVNAWHSRVGSIEHPDYAVLDLDPDPKAGFAGVIAVARAVRDELTRRGLDAVAKTSGSRGIHILIPLAAETTFDDSAALAEDVATSVTRSQPTLATVERALDERPRGTVYVDHLQNAAGKTLAAVFSVRAKPDATVSAPLTWRQVTRALRIERFTMATVARRRTELIARWREVMNVP